MLQRVFPVLFVLFLVPLMCAAQSAADSIGTIHVKKKSPVLTDSTPQEEAVYLIIGQMPSFPNDGMTMSEFIDSAFVVPQQAIDRGISGTVVVSCVVDTNGELKNAKIARELPNCPDCNAEALRVVSQMPLWIPGRHNGRPVPVKISIPVRFRFNQ